MDKVQRPGNVEFVNITVCYNKHLTIDNGYNGFYSTRRGKKFPLLYFETDKYGDSANQKILNKAYDPYIAQLIYGKTLYVCPQSKIPRDLLRSSDYKITYSKEKADYIIIPKPEECGMFWTVNMIARDINTNRIFMCNINNNSSNYYPAAEEYLKKIAEVYNIDIASLEYACRDVISNTFRVYPFQDIPEYIEIINGTLSYPKYILDCNLPIIPANKIDVEVLDLWSRLAKSDENMFQKSVLNSNVRDYPYTFYVFMRCEPNTRWTNYPQLNWLFKSMGIDYRSDPFTGYIEPADMEMLNKWITYKLGIPEEGGYILSTTKKANSDYLQYVQKRLAVKPIKITEPITHENFMILARN